MGAEGGGRGKGKGEGRGVGGLLALSYRPCATNACAIF